MEIEDAITSPKQDGLSVHLICSLLFLQYKPCLLQSLTKYQHPGHMPVKYLSICSRREKHIYPQLSAWINTISGFLIVKDMKIRFANKKTFIDHRISNIFLRGKKL